jgi:hypothetical protein
MRNALDEGDGTLAKKLDWKRDSALTTVAAGDGEYDRGARGIEQD